ncbi:MAG TPA: histidine kinase N-terminal 7TM domain-containing protein [Tangfeifania sp.]|nr:histidine kinase N-terminal 7TM domain-containing protein [Tangfeifania sp.]
MDIFVFTFCSCIMDAMVLNKFFNESLIEFMAALIALSTILVLWRYRKADEVRFLIFVQLFAAIWALTYALEFSTQNFEMKILWSQASYFGIAFLPLSYFLFTTAFSQKTDLINPRNIALLSVIPFITVLLVFTNESHHLVWKTIVLSEEKNMLLYQHGIWFWIFWTFSIILILAGLYNLYQSIYKFPAFYKSQVNTLLIATIIPLIGNLMYVTGLNPFPGVDWTPLLFVFTGLVITFGVIKYRMFDLVPFARNKLVDTMKDGVLVVNAEGFIEDCNDAALQIFNLQPHLVIRKSFKSSFSNHKKFITGINNEKQQSIEIEMQKPEGVTYYQTLFSPVFNKKNEFSGHFILIHDITTMKKTEVKLKNVNQQLVAEIDKRGKLIHDLESFSHAVAHDLKNSLGSISSSTEILQDSIKKNDTESLNEITELIKISADKAMHITKELLTLARISQQEVELEPLNMQAVFNEALQQLKLPIEESGAEIKSPENWPRAMGYAPWIEEIWTNYLSNAIKYGGSPIRIEVGSEIHDNCVKFWVKDNGDGLTKEEQAKLFSKYVRLAPEKAEGYGLGLSIVKSIADKLDQSVGVESTGIKGEGSRFYFALPLQKV